MSGQPATAPGERNGGRATGADGAAPLVSVVMPAYNHEAYVAEAIASALGQPIDLELVVVDDGSTDRTAEIVAAIDDPRIRLVRQANAGSHAAINRGIALARGRYVSILNSDDRYVPGRLAALTELAAGRAPKPTLAVTAVRLIDAQGAPLDEGSHPWLSMYREILEAWAVAEDTVDALLWGNFAVSTSNLF
ncbi:MAG: glycosyltransferase family 2 protein, partial [Burkholderiales bacterium]